MAVRPVRSASRVLDGRREGKRFAVAIPDEVVPEVRVAVANRRTLHTLVREGGVRAVAVV